jgi:hypothetical protein
MVLWISALNDLISEIEALIEFSDTDEVKMNNSKYYSTKSRNTTI